MKPEEIAPHVGKGKRLVTVECDEIRHSIKPGWYSAVDVGGWSVFTGAPSDFHSIRPVGEACEWREMERTERSAAFITGCDCHVVLPSYVARASCICGKPIKEVGGGDE